MCIFSPREQPAGPAAGLSDVMKNLLEVPVVAAAQTYCSALAQRDAARLRSRITSIKSGIMATPPRVSSSNKS